MKTTVKKTIGIAAALSVPIAQAAAHADIHVPAGAFGAFVSGLVNASTSASPVAISFGGVTFVPNAIVDQEHMIVPPVPFKITIPST